jgi:hypothetical protein
VRRLRVTDVLLGFRDACEEAAFQLNKAMQLETTDVWTLGMIFTTSVMGLVAAAFALGLDSYCSWVFMGCSSCWLAVVMVPAAVLRASRPFYLAHRGWLWGITLLFAVSSPVITNELLLTRAQAAALNVVVLARAGAFAAMEFVIRPALLRLSAPHQALASVGSAFNTYYVSNGPPDGPFTLAACLAMGGGAVVLAALLDARARLRWLLVQQRAEQVPAAGASHAAKSAATPGSTSA